MVIIFKWIMLPLGCFSFLSLRTAHGHSDFCTHYYPLSSFHENPFLIPAWDRWLLLTVKYLIFRFIPAVTTTANLVFILSLVQNDVQFLFISGKMNTGHRFSEESCTFFCLLISPVFLSKHSFIWAIYVFSLPISV